MTSAEASFFGRGTTRMRALPNMSVLAPLVRDHAGGRVTAVDGTARVDYRLTERDLGDTRHGIEASVRVMAAAGALGKLVEVCGISLGQLTRVAATGAGSRAPEPGSTAATRPVYVATNPTRMPHG